MQTKFVEVSNGFNWGKFLVCRFTREEWAIRSKVDEGSSLVGGRGWTPRHLWVLDLQTGEGAMFKPGGYAKGDLDKHQVWVCPMFGVFLNKLYATPEWGNDIGTIPDLVELTDEDAMKASAMFGHRRPGPSPEERQQVVEASVVKPKRKRV